MNAVALSKQIIAVALLALSVSSTQAEPEQVDSSPELAAEQQGQASKRQKFIVVKEDGNSATIDLDAESGAIVINASDENGKKTEVDIALGGIGKSIIAEIVEDLAAEGLDGDGPIEIEISNDDTVVVQQNGNKEIIKRKINRSSSSDSDGGMGFMESLVAITAIVLVFGTPLLIVIVVMYARHKRHALVHGNIDKLIDSGQQIPAEIFQEATGRNNDPRRKGIVLVAIGAAVMVCFAMIWSVQVASLGLIPLMMGVANLLIWKTEPGNKNP